jgi:hypothetical protein
LETISTKRARRRFCDFHRCEYADDDRLLAQMDAYWRASNHVSKRQHLYVNTYMDNPLLKEPLKREQYIPCSRQSGVSALAEGTLLSNPTVFSCDGWASRIRPGHQPLTSRRSLRRMPAVPAASTRGRCSGRRTCEQTWARSRGSSLKWWPSSRRQLGWSDQDSGILVYRLPSGVVCHASNRQVPT